MMPTDLAPWFGGAALATGAWLGHRLLRWLERRGWLYYLGLDIEPTTCARKGLRAAGGER